MGKIEEQSKKRTRNQEIKALILGTAMLTGGIAIALVAPNVLGAMAKLGLIPKDRQGEYIQAARKRLKKQGLLIEQNGFLRITTKGQKQLRSLARSLALPSRLKRWDRKWRVLIFDIPEYRRAIRDAIRQQLIFAGFSRIQDSVWIYPYPCEEFIALLKADLKIGKDLLYLIVDTLEGDKRFCEVFGLSRASEIHMEAPPLPKVLEMVLNPIFPKYDNYQRS